jgi:3-methyladenine DNA glycosylase AlkD
LIEEGQIFHDNMKVKTIQERLRHLADEEKAEVLKRFFKTGPGEYGEGDVFLGLAVPQLRKLAGEYLGIRSVQLKSLIRSPVHEERMLALLILIRQYREGHEGKRKQIHTFYLSHSKFVNNWDLVDLSAPLIVGDFLLHRNRKTIYALVCSSCLWERRMAVLATFAFIKNGEFSDTLTLAEKLLFDKEDLIHKAVGWMLREVGKRDVGAEEGFLRAHYRKMPRTMLRYAIEKFAPSRRKLYLKGEI